MKRVSFFFIHNFATYVSCMRVIKTAFKICQIFWRARLRKIKTSSNALDEDCEEEEEAFWPRPRRRLTSSSLSHQKCWVFYSGCVNNERWAKGLSKAKRGRKSFLPEKWQMSLKFGLSKQKPGWAKQAVNRDEKSFVRSYECFRSLFIHYKLCMYVHEAEWSGHVGRLRRP